MLTTLLTQVAFHVCEEKSVLNFIFLRQYIKTSGPIDLHQLVHLFQHLHGATLIGNKRKDKLDQR